MEVLINNRQKKSKLNLRRIRSIAEEVMRFEGQSEQTELSVVFCDDDFIQKLNDQYLGKNRPTDVLSFPMEEDDFDNDVKMLGDVVISIETAERQAAKMRHSIGHEVVFLLIHGLLHLIGYDHATNKTEMNRMRQREETICRLLAEKKLLKGLEKTAESSLIGRSTSPSKTRS